MRGSSGQTWVGGWGHRAALWSRWPADPGFRADSSTSEPQGDRVTCDPSHSACSASPDPAGNWGPWVPAALLCRLERRPLLHMAGRGLSPPARASRGAEGPLGQMNQSLPSSNSLLFVLLQVENALSPPRCPARHPHALPQGPEACLWERPFHPTNPCKAMDQTRPSLGDPGLGRAGYPRPQVPSFQDLSLSTLALGARHSV